MPEVCESYTCASYISLTRQNARFPVSVPELDCVGFHCRLMDGIVSKDIVGFSGCT